MFAVRPSESQLSLMPMCVYGPQKMRNSCEFDSLPTFQCDKENDNDGEGSEGGCLSFLYF